MGTGIRFGRAASATVVMVCGAVFFGYPAASAGPSPQPPPLSSRLAGTWGACGSWWAETATESSSGSVCGVDGVVSANGEATQLAEPLISVSRYVCFKTKRREPCHSESFEGPLRRTEMTVDPLLRRATIRGMLGGCALDVEFTGLGTAQPQGNLSEWHGLTAGSPSVAVSGSQTFTAQAGWWGTVCGQLLVLPPEDQGSQAWIFRGAEASLTGGNGGGGCGCGVHGCAALRRPVTAC